MGSFVTPSVNPAVLCHQGENNLLETGLSHSREAESCVGIKKAGWTWITGFLAVGQCGPLGEALSSEGTRGQ